MAPATTTALIFDDGVYIAEALALPATHNEDDVDAELAVLAAERGIQHSYQFLCPPQYLLRALSTMTADSDDRSSRSLHSQETESTSLTSAPSRTSRDQLFSKQWLPLRRAPPERKRPSPPLHASTPTAIPGHAKPTPSVVTSALPNSSSLQQPPPRRRRASNLFSRFRKDASSCSCSSRSHHAHHSKSQSVKLECGHVLSPPAVRIHVQEALQHERQITPNCCGIPLPRTAMAPVLTKEEMELVVGGAVLPSTDTGSLPDSGYSENGMSSMDLPRSSQGDSEPTATLEAQNAHARRAQRQDSGTESGLVNEAFTDVKTQQKEQFERIAMFECSQHKALAAHQQHSFQRLVAQQEASRNERREQHAQEIERLEERQISAEHDLRQAHEQETRNVATALKHMEAYCLGTNANHTEYAHEVTQEDLKKLDRQRQTQQNLPRKHQNAINVLRARQERDMKRKMEKHALELDALDVAFAQDKLTEQATYLKERERLDALIAARRKRILRRWDLKFKLWRREWETLHHTALTLPLEHEHWPSPKSQHLICIPDSSALAAYTTDRLDDLSSSHLSAATAKRMTL